MLELILLVFGLMYAGEFVYSEYMDEKYYKERGWR